MFMGPYEGNVVWSTRTIQGVRRFVSKYYTFLNNAYQNRVESSDIKVKRGVDRLVSKIEGSIMDFKFNTAIASLMEFYNTFSKYQFDNKDLEKIVLLTAPILPHMAEEIWCCTMGKEYSVHAQKWPEVDESMIKEDEFEIPVQINGKVRGRIVVTESDSQESIKEKVLSSDTLGPQLSNKEIKKLIYVPQRIVSIIL